MIGLILLALTLAWLIVSAKIAAHVTPRFRSKSMSRFVGLTAFVLLTVLPFLDELIGRWQFRKLCETEAVAWVSPDAHQVVAAKVVHDDRPRYELIFPVSQQASKYEDLQTGKVFYSYTAFHTPGGFLMQAGLGLGNSTSCWPEKWMSRDFGLDIDELLRRGKQ